MASKRFPDTWGDGWWEAPRLVVHTDRSPSGAARAVCVLGFKRLNTGWTRPWVQVNAEGRVAHGCRAEGDQAGVVTGHMHRYGICKKGFLLSDRNEVDHTGGHRRHDGPGPGGQLVNTF
ncbi:hypothetical protein GCM10026982_30540 [Nocardiopsis aegyptia]